MSEVEEQQNDEREALASIYEGDSAFKQVDTTTFQYKYGEDDAMNSFLLELLWGGNYPNEAPSVNLDMFYNQNLTQSIKDQVKTIIETEAQQWIGCGMTYTLFECLKERLAEILAHKPETVAASAEGVSRLDLNATSSDKALPKKEQLTKSQKRRQWERTDHKGERMRGWNWVDIVKHLSQTGYKEDTATSVTT